MSNLTLKAIECVKQYSMKSRFIALKGLCFVSTKWLTDLSKKWIQLFYKKRNQNLGSIGRDRDISKDFSNYVYIVNIAT